MRTIPIPLILSLINLWFACYSQVLVKPSNSFFEEELKDSPKIIVYTKNLEIYEFNENQYEFVSDSLSGIGSRVTYDTLSTGMQFYDNTITRNLQPPENVKIDLNNISQIEYHEYSSNTNLLIGVVLVSLLVYFIISALTFDINFDGKPLK